MQRIKYRARNVRTHIIIFCYCNYCHYGYYYCCDYYEKEVQRFFLVLFCHCTPLCVILIGGAVVFFNAKYQLRKSLLLVNKQY